MPSDIRSFFGGKPAGTLAEKPKQEDKPKKRGRARKVVHEDDEEDEEEPAAKKASSKKSTPKKKPEPAPVLEETTADDFFNKDSKPRRSDDVRPKARSKPAETPKKSAPKANGNTPTPSRRASTRVKTRTKDVDINDDDFPDDDLEDGAEDVFKSNARTGRRIGDDYEEGTEDEDPKPQKKPAGRQKKMKKDDDDFQPEDDAEMKDTNPEDDFVVPDDEEEIVADLPAKRTPAKGTRKRKSTALEDDDDDDLEVKKAKPAKKRATPSKNTKKKEEEPREQTEVQSIFKSIPTIEPPPPPPKSGEAEEGKRKFQFGQHANSAVPAGALSIDEIPNGAENCLAGLTFVFTGQLQRLGREQGQNLVKQYGGKVTTAPSKKTSFVVLGEDPGPKKLETIQKYSLTVINEDGLLELIKRMPANGGDSAAAEKYAEELAKEEENIRKAAEEIEQQERARLAAAKPKPQSSNGLNSGQAAQNGSSGKDSEAGPDTRLWTARYAPQSLNQICGNNGQVEKLQRWLHAFPKSQERKFKLPGPDGSGIHRAVMIHGPPGIGKTTAAHLVARMEGYDVVESNASDTRSKKLVETGLKGVLSTTSLMGYFAQGANEVEASKKKLVLIMDEVDGMSAGDRGGVGALAAVCKKSQIPMILICNERKQPKMRPFDFVTYDLPFRRPTAKMIRSRISTIAFREGLKLPAPVINALIEGTGSDIRQVINMLSTAKLDSQTMTFEETQDMTKAWEKHIVLKPWDMVGKILGGGMFNAASKTTLNDKSELYFNDHEFAPLMLQENYLGTNPQRTNVHNDNQKLKRLASLDMVSKAADSISDGDLVDRMIHGSQQQWSLMPAHAIFSFVRPASFVYGTMAGNQTRFTSWLGKNSNQAKLMRFVKEIQGHMRLRVSADRHEIRQTYLPMLFEKLIKRLEAEGKEVVPEMIELMDFYYLTKDDWDAILELGVGQADMERVNIESQAKATFTRLYNQQSHPLPFIKASQIMAPKRAPAKEKPDLEEALEESEEEVIDENEVKEEDEEDLDLTKDKYVKQPKKKSAAAAKAGASKKKNAKDTDDGSNDVEEEDVKPKKAKGKGRAKK